MSALNFSDPEAVNAHVLEKESILVAHRNCHDYPGMVQVIVIRWDKRTTTYQLDLQWECQGLDFYGDTLMKTYLYEFESFKNLMEYLVAKYDIKATDVPIKHQFDPTPYPNYLKDEAKRPEFETAWKQFQQDFKSGTFLDPSLKLIYSS